MTSVTCVMCGSLRDKTRVRLLVAANYTLKQVSYTPLLVNDTHLFKDQLSLRAFIQYSYSFHSLAWPV